jgi:ATP-dependent Lon protease
LIIDYLCLYLNVNLKNNGVLNFKPILLLSKNGIGKSSFLRKLSNIFNLYNNFINYSSITTPSEISGLTPMWRTGNVGFIAQCINNNNVYNPIIILEELDKANKNHYNGNIFTPLFDLLEKRSASIFYENGLATNINFSYVNFIATANNLSEVNFGILNRFKIFEIEEPKDLDMFNIVNSIYKDYLEEDLFKNLTINEDGIRSISNACVLSNIKNVRAISKMIEDILIDGLNNLIDNNLESFEIDYLSDKYLMENKTLH